MALPGGGSHVPGNSIDFPRATSAARGSAAIWVVWAPAA